MFLLLIVTALQASAATFVVTSNADSGPGTLREALTLAAANGNAEKDFITFLLPGNLPSDRTINLLSVLPAITSDMLIDGSTQPGADLSVNGAKVAVFVNSSRLSSTEALMGFYIKGVNNIEIDGLIIKGSGNGAGGFYGGVAILIDGINQNIIIGRPGKGNVIYDCGEAIQCVTGGTFQYPDKSQTDKIVLQNNLLGVQEDGVTISAFTQSMCNFPFITDVTLGGDTRAEGNIFYGIVTMTPAITGTQLTKNVRIKIKNNIVGANKLQQLSTDPAVIDHPNQVYVSVSVQPNQVYNVASDIDISDNIFGCTVGVMGFQNLTMKIQHNFFGVSEDLQNKLPITIRALYLNYLRGRILVGGAGVGMGNVFANSVQALPTGSPDPVISVEDFGINLHPNFLVELSKNSFFCNKGAPLAYVVPPGNKPWASLSVDNLTAATVSGTSVPNARIELFYTDKECTQCQPKTYLTTVTADGEGKWIYNGALVNGLGIMASATLNNLSSEFTDTRVYDESVLINHVLCDKLGSITRMNAVHYKKAEWTNVETGKVVGTGLDLLDVPAGRYQFKAEQFGCTQYSDIFLVGDLSPNANDVNKKIVQPACGVGGSISGLYLNNAYSVEWVNGNGVVVGDQADISDLPPGEYTLRMKGLEDCIKTYGPVILTNPTAPVINQNNYTLTPTLCNQAVGSITGITASGGAAPLTYSWKNAQGFEAGTNPNLINQPAGKYKLYVSDASQCAPVVSDEFEITESNGVSIDYSTQGGRSSTCDQPNGSITGLKAPGAITFEWTITGTATNVGHQLDLTNVPANFYTLTISNATCSRSYDFEVPGFPPTVFTGITYTKTKTCDAFATGTITLNTENANEEPLQYQWFDEQGNAVGYAKVVQFLKAGNYHLKLTNKNYCIVDYPEVFTIEAYPEFKVQNFGSVTNTLCGVGTGGVSATVVSGGTGNYAYQWFNADNNTPLPGKTQASVDGLPAGHYRLQITDGGCNLAEPAYNIIDEAATPPVPSVDNVRLYNAGKAVLKVNNPFPTAIYRLYESADSPQSVLDNIGGTFDISVTESRSYYVSLTYGYCESERTEVKIVVSALTGGIANTFTPNGDGINDYWLIRGLDTYPDASVSVYNRYGSAVFQSLGYSKPFDGNRNGAPLPAGVYYYVIDLKRGGLLSGSLTIIR